LLRALKSVVEAYYSEAEVLDEKHGLKKASSVSSCMKEYLEAFNP